MRLLKANEMQNGISALQLDSIANAPRNYRVDYKYTSEIKRDRYIACYDLYRLIGYLENKLHPMRDYLSMDGRVYRILFCGKLCTDNRTLSFKSFCV